VPIRAHTARDATLLEPTTQAIVPDATYTYINQTNRPFNVMYKQTSKQQLYLVEPSKRAARANNAARPRRRRRRAAAAGPVLCSLYRQSNQLHKIYIIVQTFLVLAFANELDRASSIRYVVIVYNNKNQTKTYIDSVKSSCILCSNNTFTHRDVARNRWHCWMMRHRRFISIFYI
jgi:hypothetical protein